MKLDFVNREAELRELETAARHGGLLVVFGRRRVGKTRLLRRWLETGDRHGLYSQAIEAQRDLQIQQVFADLRPQLTTQMVPKTWPELFEIVALQPRPWVLCLDEFPYLTAVDPSLPSQLQKWLDHSLPRGCLLIVAGSSTRMMNDLFLHRSAPLYGRAHKLLHVRPMDYPAFCDACNLSPGDPDSFEKFACVGAVVGAGVRGWSAPHQSRWRTYDTSEKRKLLHDHAATVFEEVCRSRFPGAQRYWESSVELDLVAPDPDDRERLLVAELKWRRLTAAERQKTFRQLAAKWSRCSLSERHPNVRFEVFDARMLAR